ncbi:MAG: putative zinc-binding protein [Desulfobacterales bacterium]|nr:putative zinc-binding protein [Desulfobacterales bacterium]
MTENCCETTGITAMLLPCSGGSNVGQLANRAAVELTTEGFGKIFCLAGIGGRISGFVQSAKDAESVIVIDGCEIGCGKATLQGAGCGGAAAPPQAPGGNRIRNREKQGFQPESRRRGPGKAGCEKRDLRGGIRGRGSAAVCLPGTRRRLLLRIKRRLFRKQPDGFVNCLKTICYDSIRLLFGRPC